MKVGGASAPILESRPTPLARRLFFAIWPDEATREALRRSTRHVLRHCGGKPVRAENFHITLAFVGNVPARHFDALVEAAGGVSPEPLVLTLDRFGYFAAPQVLWLGPAQTPGALRALSRDLRAALDVAGFTHDAKPFNAHLTLARKVRTEPKRTPPQPVAWPISGFALVESDTDPAGAEYRVIATFPAV